ncbi:hypothetical protein E4099_25830 [Streptomyces palmae]|uniref:Uncharacterized protein n=1 Tax=Streptomyces palmae TaxID=1701085 RepID=A0A4Z0GFX1_9ACTN|nr:hypothetical protein E4099_25830 [Streptomyces palmae]
MAIAAIGGVAASGGGGDDKKNNSASQHGGQSGKDGGKDSGGKQEEAAKKAFDGDGTFQVGSDIKPGTYRTSGNGVMDGCYWERSKDASGDPDSIIANDNVTGSSYVTVKAGDKVFTTNGCKDWEEVPAKATGTPKTEMSGKGGMYRVGVDIAPGTYKSTGNTEDAGCYWERAKDALHGIDSIAANDNATGNAVVTIAPTDAYFKTNDCTDWKKTS